MNFHYLPRTWLEMGIPGFLACLRPSIAGMLLFSPSTQLVMSHAPPGLFSGQI
jgi:hypothetical protein